MVFCVPPSVLYVILLVKVPGSVHVLGLVNVAVPRTRVLPSAYPSRLWSPSTLHVFTVASLERGPRRSPNAAMSPISTTIDFRTAHPSFSPDNVCSEWLGSMFSPYSVSQQ